MMSPFANGELVSCLESIRDVAHDLGREIERVASDGGSTVKALVADIEAQAQTAVNLIHTVSKPERTTIEIDLIVNNIRRTTFVAEVPKPTERIRDMFDGWIGVTDVYQQSEPAPRLVVVARRIDDESALSC
jgi:hypothetical protein